MHSSLRPPRPATGERHSWHCDVQRGVERPPLNIAGAHGGSQLARPAASISAAEIIDAIEGPVAITECSGVHSACDFENVCSTGSAWQHVNLAIRRSLDELSLAQLSGQETVLAWRPELSPGTTRPLPAVRPGRP